jgi:hypothetical protein
MTEKQISMFEDSCIRKHQLKSIRVQGIADRHFRQTDPAAGDRGLRDRGSSARLDADRRDPVRGLHLPGLRSDCQ